MREQHQQRAVRHLQFGALGAPLPVGMRPPFVVLLPAYTAAECAVAAELIPALVGSGCVEICCVGTSAEALHDVLDGILEDVEAFHVVTTFHASEGDACEYFLFAAGGAEASLLALVLPHSSLVSRLHALAEGILA